MWCYQFTELWDEQDGRWKGDRAESTFPVLIKVLFCGLFPNTDSRMGAIRFLLESDRPADSRCQSTTRPYLWTAERCCVRNLSPSLAMTAVILLAWQSVHLLFTQRVFTQIKAHRGKPLNSRTRICGGAYHSNGINTAKAEVAYVPNSWWLVNQITEEAHGTKFYMAL